MASKDTSKTLTNENTEWFNRLILEKAYVKGQFKLRSGKTSNHYFGQISTGI